MTKHTTRDYIWSAALEIAAEKQSASRWSRRFGWSDVADRLDEPPSERTIRDTLATMVDLGYLKSSRFGKGQYEPPETSLE